MQHDNNQIPAIELINVSRRFVSPTGKSLTALRDFNTVSYTHLTLPTNREV